MLPAYVKRTYIMNLNRVNRIGKTHYLLKMLPIALLYVKWTPIIHKWPRHMRDLQAHKPSWEKSSLVGERRRVYPLDGVAQFWQPANWGKINSKPDCYLLFKLPLPLPPLQPKFNPYSYYTRKLSFQNLPPEATALTPIRNRFLLPPRLVIFISYT